MSTFAVKAYKIEKVESHPGADKLDIIKLEGMDYILISQKGLRKVGEIVIYCPEDSLIPEYLLRQGFWDEARGKGMLSGSLGNRVKPKRLRGVFSEGIIFKLEYQMDLESVPVQFLYKLGDREVIIREDQQDADLSKQLEITKFEPKLPQGMQCRAVGVFQDLTINYDFESIKKDPDMFYGYEVKEVEKIHPDGYPYPGKVRTVLYDQPEQVWISEKIHGSLFMIGICKPEAANEKFYKDRVYFSSKGLGARGIVLDHTDEGNMWVRALKKYDMFEKLSSFLNNFSFADFSPENSSLLLFGEVYGSGVQDMEYGLPQGDIRIRLFDAALVKRHEDYVFLEYEDLVDLALEIQIPMVPTFSVGPYSTEWVKQLTDGLETVSGKFSHIREGVVIKSIKNHFEPRSNRWLRNVAKSVSEAYKERKGNTTEFN